MITREVVWFQVSTRSGHNISHSPQPIHDFAFLVPEECGRSQSFVMLLEDEIVHAEVSKERLDEGASDFIIQVSAKDDLISALDPGLNFCFEVFHEGISRVAVIIVVIEVGLVLGPGSAFPTGALTGSIHTHHSQDHAMLSSEPGPCPPAQLGVVAAGAHCKVADLVMG